jgi:hypothetical protein
VTYRHLFEPIPVLAGAPEASPSCSRQGEAKPPVEDSRGLRCCVIPTD